MLRILTYMQKKTIDAEKLKFKILHFFLTFISNLFINKFRLKNFKQWLENDLVQLIILMIKELNQLHSFSEFMFSRPGKNLMQNIQMIINPVTIF